MAVKLIVGLGNPGQKYVKTRHNAGFLFLQRVIERYAFAPLSPDKNCKGRISKGLLAGEKTCLLTPDTYMNLSGQSVQATCAYYKIELKDILVVHDELDLPAGVVRLKQGGGHGGNNGLRDIIQKTASRDFMRLRIGIGHPGVGKDVSSYVLKSPSKSEAIGIEHAMDAAIDELESIVQQQLEYAMNRLHTLSFE